MYSKENYEIVVRFQRRTSTVGVRYNNNNNLEEKKITYSYLRATRVFLILIVYIFLN